MRIHHISMRLRKSVSSVRTEKNRFPLTARNIEIYVVPWCSDTEKILWNSFFFVITAAKKNQLWRKHTTLEYRKVNGFYFEILFQTLTFIQGDIKDLLYFIIQMRLPTNRLKKHSHRFISFILPLRWYVIGAYSFLRLPNRLDYLWLHEN